MGYLQGVEKVGAFTVLKLLCLEGLFKRLLLFYQFLVNSELILGLFLYGLAPRPPQK